MKALKVSLLAAAMLIDGAIAQAETKISLEACLERPERACIGMLTGEFLIRTNNIDHPSRQAEMRYGMAVQLIRAKQFEWAEQIARRVTVSRIREPILGTLASEFASAGDVASARRILQDITDPVITTIVLTAIAHVDVTSDTLQESLKRAKALKDDGMRFITYDAITKNLIKTGRLKEAEDTARLITYAPSRNFLFERIAEKLIGRDQFDEALLVAEKIETVSSRIISLTELAWLFHSNGRSDVGTRLLDEARTRISLIQPNDENQLRARVMLAENLAKFGQIERALIIADSLENGRDKVSVWLPAVTALRDNNNIADAGRLYEKMKQAAASAKSPSERYQILKLLISHLSRVGDTEDALGLARQLDAPEDRARNIQEIGASRLKHGFVDQAATIFRSIGNPDIRARNLVNVAREMLKTARRVDAISLAYEAAVAGAELTDQAIRDELNSLLAKFHMASGEVGKARSAWTAIANNYIRQSTLGDLVKIAESGPQQRVIREALSAEIGRVGKDNEAEKVQSFLRLAKLPEPFITEQDIINLASLFSEDTARGEFVTAAAYLLMDAGKVRQARALVRDQGDKQTQLEFSVAELSWLLRQATDAPETDAAK